MDKKFGQGPPPLPHLDKIQKNSSFFSGDCPLHLDQGRAPVPWIHSTSEEQVWSGISTGGRILDFLKDFFINKLKMTF